MANEVIGIDVEVKLDQLKAELGKIPDIGEKNARALVGNLSRELKKAEKAARDAAKGSGAALGRIGDAADNAGRAAVKLRGALGSISPEAAGIASVVDDAADALEALGLAGGAAGPLAAVLGTVAAVALVVAGNVREAGEAAAMHARVAEEGERIHAALSSIYEAQEAAALALAVATGQLSEAEAKAARIRAAAFDTWQQQTGQTREKIAALQDTQQSFLGQVLDVGEAINEATGGWNVIGEAIDGFTTSASEAAAEERALNDELREQAGSMGAALDKTLADIAATDALAGAKGGAAAATRELAEAHRQYEAVLAEERSRVDSIVDGLAALQAETDQATLATLSGTEAIRGKADLALMALAEERDALMATARTDEERAAIAQAVYDRRVSIERQAASEIAEITEESAEAAAKQRAKDAEDYAAWLDQRVEETRAANEAMASAVSGLMGDVSGFASQMASDMAESNKEAAMAWWALSKAAAISTAVVNTAMAVTSALAVPPAPNIALAAVAGAAGAVQIAAIAAEQPAFHAGGVMYPDERGATLLSGEAVLNRQATAALGAGGVAALNQGGASGGGATVLRIGRMEAREIVRTDIKSGGAIVSALRKVTTREGRPAGRSGRGPVA